MRNTMNSKDFSVTKSALLHCQNDIEFTINSYRRSQLSNHEIAFKNDLKINILIWVSQSSNTMKECNFSIWMKRVACDAMTEKSPNVPEWDLHWVDGFIIFLLWCEWMLNPCLFFICFCSSSAFLFYEMHLRDIFELWQDHICDKQKTRPSHIKNGSFIKCIPIVYNRQNICDTRRFRLLASIFIRIIHSSVWHADIDYGHPLRLSLSQFFL